MTSRSPASGESERDRDRDRERELATASRSPDSGECERGGDGERELATTSRSPDSGECERGGDIGEREIATTSRSPDSGECDRGGDIGEREIATTSRSPDSGECDRGGDGEKETESAMASSSSARTRDYWNGSYWDERYRNNYYTYDWYVNYPSLVSLFNLYLRLHHRILIIGCGNSALGEGMVDNGYQDVVNIDISSVLIEIMQAKYAHKLALKYIKMDVRDMSPFESCSFDAVIDKGTLDTLLCGEDDIADATQLLKEVGRVLKDKGAYILISFGAPNHRLDLLWSVELWNIKLHFLERVEKSSCLKTWELSAPHSLDRDGSWVTEALVCDSDVFYVYVCIKDESLSAKQAPDTEISSSQNDT